MTPSTRHALPSLLCACAFLLGPLQAEAGQVLELLAPSDGFELAAPSFQLVYRTTARVALQVELDGVPLTAQPRIAREDDGQVYHLRVPVGVGDHQLRLLDAAGGEPLASVALSRTDSLARSSSKRQQPPDLFHSRERESACAGCHLFPGPDETQLEAPTRASVVCGTCHPAVRSGDQVHGPVAVGACYTCHDPAYAPSRFATRPALEVCGSCHAEVVAAVRGGAKFAHGPVVAGACTACHSPHASDHTTLLRAPPTQLCLRCHGDTLPRPVEAALHGKLGCTECHAPHGGDTAALTATPGNDFCTGCHRGVDPVAAGHPIIGHPVSTAEGVGADDRPVSCTSCHPPHGTADVTKLDIVTDETAQRRFCTGCHT